MTVSDMLMGDLNCMFSIDMILTEGSPGIGAEARA